MRFSGLLALPFAVAVALMYVCGTVLVYWGGDVIGYISLEPRTSGLLLCIIGAEVVGATAGVWCALGTRRSVWPLLAAIAAAGVCMVLDQSANYMSRIGTLFNPIIQQAAATGAVMFLLRSLGLEMWREARADTWLESSRHASPSPASRRIAYVPVCALLLLMAIGIVSMLVGQGWEYTITYLRYLSAVIVFALLSPVAVWGALGTGVLGARLLLLIAMPLVPMLPLSAMYADDWIPISWAFAVAAVSEMYMLSSCIVLRFLGFRFGKRIGRFETVAHS